MICSRLFAILLALPTMSLPRSPKRLGERFDIVEILFDSFLHSLEAIQRFAGGGHHGLQVTQGLRKLAQRFLQIGGNFRIADEVFEGLGACY